MASHPPPPDLPLVLPKVYYVPLLFSSAIPTFLLFLYKNDVYTCFTKYINFVHTVLQTALIASGMALEKGVQHLYYLGT